MAESISWIYTDTLLLSNEMCGEGLTETDGEDYRISDCKADRQLVGDGAHLRATDPSLMLHSREEVEEPHTPLNQDNHHFLYLHPPPHAVGGLV